jgi:hypothetical protein
MQAIFFDIQQITVLNSCKLILLVFTILRVLSSLFFTLIGLVKLNQPQNIVFIKHFFRYNIDL